jgi:hypothetical protein
MQTVDPLDARRWFVWKGPVNWVISIAVFIPAFLLLMQFLGGFLAFLIVFPVVGCLFFYGLDKRAIGIKCPHCGEFIESNTPWICGNKDSPHRNDRVDELERKNSEQLMDKENIKVEAVGGLEKEVMPPPPRKRGQQNKVLLASIAGLVVLIAVIFYYSHFIAPYKSTDDAFVDGYVTLISPRVPGQVTRLLVTDNQEVKAGDVLVEIDPRDYRNYA